MPECNSKYEVGNREPDGSSGVLGKRTTGRPSDRPSKEGRLAESAGQSFWGYT